MRRPGIEPGSIDWKATMLTITPPTLDFLMHLAKLEQESLNQIFTQFTIKAIVSKHYKVEL